MSVFVGVLLTVLTFAFIVYPFFRQQARLATSTEDDQSQELFSRRDTTYAMLKELEFDYRSGLLTEEDYLDLEARYKRKAVSILKGIDDLAKSDDVEDEIEERVMALRKGKAPVSADDEIERQVLALRKGKAPASASADDEIEREVATLRQSKGGFCTQCGAKVRATDRFCAKCGTRIT